MHQMQILQKQQLSQYLQTKMSPYLCQSDNGSPFQSEELKEFAKESGYYHHRVTPEWPGADGTVERFNRSMKEAVQS